MADNAAVSRSYFLDSCHLTIADFSGQRILSLVWNQFLHFLTLKLAFITCGAALQLRLPRIKLAIAN